MGKKKLYMVLDTETATLPFVKDFDESTRKDIAIAKPLVYDLGWTIVDRKGNVYDKRNYLIQETFFVPNIFNTAYYKDKRPKYMELLAQGKIETKCWNDAMAEMIKAMRDCYAVCAYNAAFDFKKAIPFTEKYIKALYSSDYNKWEQGQKWHIQKIVNGERKSGTNPRYLKPIFEIRGEQFPIVDLWALACDFDRKLINIDKYRKFCLERKYWTASCVYFKTSAETAFQYLMNKYDFIEAHTALDDAEIESQILVKALSKGKVDPVMGAFPFRDLGTTVDFIVAHDDGKSAESLYNALEAYYEGIKQGTPYAGKIYSMLEKLNNYLY